MTVLIRCDANKDIATGHIKRCMSIASELVKKGAEVLFVVASADSVKYVEADYKYIKLDNEYNEPDIEIDSIVGILGDIKPDLMLVDSYFVSYEYMYEVRKYVRTAYIDDLYERVWPVDIIVNYSIAANTYPYEKDYGKSIKILGPKYMPINEVYKNAEACLIRETARNILIVSGGSDENHVMLNILKLLDESCGKVPDDKKAVTDNLHFTFICGAFNQDIEEMLRMSSENSNVTVLKSLPNLVEAISKSDIIVTAGGTTLYEMAILGCPGIIYKIADNQTENIAGFVNSKIALYSGDVRDNYSYDKLLDMIICLANDYKLRCQLSEDSKKLVDANGAERLANMLLNCKF